MDKRILAVLIAAAGIAGQDVPRLSGPERRCLRKLRRKWRLAQCQHRPPTRAARASTRGAARARLPTQPAAPPRSTTRRRHPAMSAPAAGVVATSPYGLCWHAGSDWTPDKAAAPCDAVPRASLRRCRSVARRARTGARAAAARGPRARAARRDREGHALDRRAVRLQQGRAHARPASRSSTSSRMTRRAPNVEKVEADRPRRPHRLRGLQQGAVREARPGGGRLPRLRTASTRAASRSKAAARPSRSPATSASTWARRATRTRSSIACLQPDRRVDAELLGSRESRRQRHGASSTGSTGTLLELRQRRLDRYQRLFVAAPAGKSFQRRKKPRFGGAFFWDNGRDERRSGRAARNSASSRHRWWDPHGEFRPLHEINPLRLRLDRRARAASPASAVLDVGCGGGILAEAMAAARRAA